MSANRTERLLNLVICLLATKRPLTREQIRRAVPGYAESESPQAFERMFERDKDDLREMGIPVETTAVDVLFEDETGYRIPREKYALPDVTFDPEELAVLTLAARAWQQATLARAAGAALLKLRADGVDVDPSDLAGIEPRVTADEPAFGALYEAVRDRRPVAFDYRGAGRAAPAPRRLEPWGVVSWRGRWYVVGRDLDREATRVFRLSRITGPVDLTGPPGSVSVPEGVDVRRQVSQLAEAPADRTARLRVRSGAGHPLRRRATAERPWVEGWDELDVPYADDETLAGELAGYADDVVAVAPEELRDAVVRRLTAVAAGGGR